MIAELNGKISRTASNLSEKLEDKLTGDFFGALRYIPYNSGLKKILDCRFSLNFKEDIELLQSNGFWSENMQFWPYHEYGELDLLFETENHILGIEIKYQSLLSSEDSHLTSLIENSTNQLAREVKIISELAKKKKKKGILLFISPEYNCKTISKKFYETFKNDIYIEFSYLSWEHILIELLKINISDVFQQLILTDLISLLKRKGFERFEDFNNGNLKVEPTLYFSFKSEIELNINFSIDTQIILGGHYEFK